jgi:hypothetical protein
MDPEQTKKFNRQIRHIATMVPAITPEDTYAFVCECGCEETVRLSAADFDREGGA